MRGFIVIALTLPALAYAAWNDHEETRQLVLDAGALSQLDIDAGAGSLSIVGSEASSDIVVTATITVPGKNADKAAARIEKDMTLTLERDGERALLQSFFESGAWNWGDQPSIDLEVRMPARLELKVDDGAGSLRVEGIDGDIRIEDGSGSMTLIDTGGDVSIDDGSGSISVEDAVGELRIVDGSGSIEVNDVQGSVFIDDGSGGIKVRDVGGDLIVEDDGSGGLRFARIQGKVEVPD